MTAMTYSHKATIYTATLLLSLASLPTPAIAQQPSAPPVEGARSDEATSDKLFNLERRRDYYERARLSPTRAVLYNVLLPGLGNWYTDEIFKGALFLTLSAMGAFFVGVGWSQEDTFNVTLGASAMAVGYGGSLITSYLDAHDYNDALRERYRLPPEGEESSLRRLPAPQGVVGWSWSIHF